MRKFNAITTMLILIMFALHAVFGSLKLFGVSTTMFSKISGFITVGLVSIHVVLSIILTVKTLIALKKSGAPYFKDNALFWAKRLSGILIMVCIVFHVLAFDTNNNRLPEFNTFKLITMILMVVTIAFHVLMNVKPMLISFGIKELKPYTADIILVLTIILALSIAAFIFYFIRWNSV